MKDILPVASLLLSLFSLFVSIAVLAWVSK